jgi:hypothetical protein
MMGILPFHSFRADGGELLGLILFVVRRLAG